MSRPVRISDVAAAAGVSITTVSHALNDKGRLTDETRQRVRDVAERLGYQPSALARGLAGGRTGMLAATVSFVDELPLAVADYDYFMGVMNAATSAALERGFSLTLVPADSRDMLERLPLDGAIVMDPVPGDQLIDLLDKRGVPVVTTGRRPDCPDDDATCWVDNDHIAGTRAMLDHLTDEGAERIALLTAPVRSSYTMDTLASYEAYCAEHDMEPLVETITDRLNEGGAYAAASHLLESDRPPDAIYATLDRLALGAMLAAEAKGIGVPGDLLVAGCTDSHASQMARPPLTALSLNPEQIGCDAVDLLTALIEKEKLKQPHRLVPFAVIPRGSTRAEVPA